MNKVIELERLSDLFWKVSPNMFFLSLLLGIVTGLSNGVLIPFLMYAVSQTVSPEYGFSTGENTFFSSPTSSLAVGFIITCFLVVIIKTLSSVMSMFIASKASAQHRLSLYKKIQGLSFRDLEKIGHARVINILNADVPAITSAAVSLPGVWMGVVTVIGLLTYLAMLDLYVFTFVLVALLVQLLTFQLPSFLSIGSYMKARDYYDQIQGGISGLVLGAKELKLNEPMFHDFFDRELYDGEKNWLKYLTRGHASMILAENYSQIYSFLVIAIVVFHFSYTQSIAQLELLSIVMVLVYLTAPLGAIASAFSEVRQGQVALKKVQDFYLSLEQEKITHKTTISPYWESLHIKDLCFDYNSSETKFVLSNVNLKFDKGQISFIVGGNGSGKSTLSKCLSLHYMPVKGQVFMDEQVVDYDSLASARSHVSAIYSDYHLFEKMYGAMSHINIEKAREYLGYLELEEKVKITEDGFNTVNLSDGQRKRLALLVLLLNDRDVCIFDEWAADQDPRFKDIFYRIILQDLKRAKKIVIVISHDDRYFDCADRIVEMADGKVKSDRLINNKKQTQSDTRELVFS